MNHPAISRVTPGTARPDRHWQIVRLGAAIIACALFVGCASQARHLAVLAPEYQPENVFTYPPFLPLNLQRVAVLPLACDEPQADLPEGCESLNPVLLAELAKLKKFEIVTVNREQLRSRTGRSTWTGAEVLPNDLFDSLQRTHGCDAVLFSQLTVFRAYAPLAVGWRFKLVDTRTRQVVWAADEVFDAGHPTVLNGARHFQFALNRNSPPSDDWGIRNSPRQFGQYAAAQLLTTLPGR